MATIEEQQVCGYTGDDYGEVMADLLPRGWVWPRDLDSVQYRLMRGLAEEFARIAGRDCDLLDESYPCGSTETLPDWERVAGLPDPCTGPLPTIQQRRAALCVKLGLVGGQSESFFIAYAAALGYTISIETFKPFQIGSRVGERLNSVDWRFVWRVNITGGVVTTYFRVGQSAVGERLAEWGDDILECALRAVAPAHLVLLFAYGDFSTVWDSSATIWDDGETGWDPTAPGEV